MIIESVNVFISTFNINMQFISFWSTALHLSVPVLKTVINDYYYIHNLYCFVCMYLIYSIKPSFNEIQQSATTKLVLSHLFLEWPRLKLCLSYNRTTNIFTDKQY